MAETTIHIFNDKKEMAESIAGILVSGIRNLSGDSYFSLALSGGSTPREIFQYLAAGTGKFIDWSRVRVFWSDERCVAPDHPESNFRMARESLLDSVSIPDANIFRIKGENDPETEARQYESLVIEKVPAVDGKTRFDLIMLGLGDDGHTASIFPDNIALFYSEKLFLASVNPYNQQIRVSATGTLINQARNVIFIATGPAKAERTAQVIRHKPGWEKLPASYVKPYNGKLIWMLDKDSAFLLENTSSLENIK